MALFLQESVQAVPSAAGITFVFPPVTSGTVWTGSVQVPAAIPNTVNPVVWTATDGQGGTPLGIWYGAAPSTTLQIRTQLFVTGIGLGNATQISAYFQGQQAQLGAEPFWNPTPPPAPPAIGFVPLQNFRGTPAINIPANGTVAFRSDGSTILNPSNAQLPWIPVGIGSSLLVAQVDATAPVQLLLYWSPTGKATDNPTGAYKFDFSGASLAGLILPNLGPFLVVGIAAGPAGATLTDLVINTGLPPITKSPQSGQVLLQFNANIADGADSGAINISPYVGEAQLMLTGLVSNASPPAGALFAVLRSTTASAGGAGNELGRFPAMSQALAAAGTTALLPPPILYVPPQICTLQIYNRIGTGAAIFTDALVIAKGP